MTERNLFPLTAITMLTAAHLGVPLLYDGGVVMPSKSPQQHRFMEAAAHNPEFAEKAGIPQKVAKEFVAADKAEAKVKRKKKDKTT